MKDKPNPLERYRWRCRCGKASGRAPSSGAASAAMRRHHLTECEFYAALDKTGEPVDDDVEERAA